VVQVRDTGCGIPQASQAEVFHEFVQLGNPERDRTKGMGLGLSIVERLCRLMAIDLLLHSEPGQGTCVELRLALLNTTETIPDTHLSGMEHRRLNLTVLVVDDEAQVRSATAMLLTELGCCCLEAEDLCSAYEVSQAQRLDFLLVDYRLRGDNDGIKVVRALREHHPDLPAAIVSGDIGSAQLQAIELAGLRLLHKPVRLDTLMQLLSDGTQRTDNTTALAHPTTRPPI
jgi:CheY-like chemotaxis protein